MMYVIDTRTLEFESEYIEEILAGGAVTCITSNKERAKRYSKEDAISVIEMGKHLFKEEWFMEEA